jgi:hypothetical protein
MRLQRVVSAFAAAIAVAGSAAPAYAFDNRASEAGPVNLVSHSTGGSSDSSSALVDIGAGAVAGMAIGSLGLAAYTRRSDGTKRRAAGVAAGRS